MKTKKWRRTMKRNFIVIILLLAAVLAQPVFSADVTEEDFKVNTTQQLLNLCNASESDPHYKEAVSFCHGFLIGALHHEMAIRSAPDICFPNPKPTRKEGVDLFLKWAKDHPQLMSQPPVETEFMFLDETWPCKK